MLSQRAFSCLGVALIALGLFVTVSVWRDALLGHSPTNASSVLVFCGPILIVAGVAMAAFPYDRLMMPSQTATGKMMTRLGCAFFLLGLAAAAGNYALIVYLVQQGS